MFGIFRPVTRIFHQHGRKAELAQSRSFMQCFNQLNDVSVPGVLANCNVLELGTAGSVFPRFFHLELGLNSTIIKNSSESYFKMLLLHASKGEFCIVNS